MKVTPSIEKTGYGLSGDIGGLSKTTYYTPDGRIVRTFPSIREYVRKNNGKVTETGTRDANLDKGWLLFAPTEFKPYCSGCDRWHDTQEEVTACIDRQQKFIDEKEREAKKEVADKTSELETKVATLEALVKKLMEVNHR